MIEKEYEVHGIKRRTFLSNTGRIDHLFKDLHETNQNLILYHGHMTDSSSLIAIITIVKLDEIYNIAVDNGALGGKLLGAGGGGFFLFYCDPMKRWNVVKSLIKIKAKVVEFNFETKGLISWKIRKK